MGTAQLRGERADVTHITASIDAKRMFDFTGIFDDPYMYDVYTLLKDEDGNILDIQKKTTGFRKGFLFYRYRFGNK